MLLNYLTGGDIVGLTTLVLVKKKEKHTICLKGLFGLDKTPLRDCSLTSLSRFFDLNACVIMAI